MCCIEPLEYPSILFGIQTVSSVAALGVLSNFSITLTLFWSDLVYQCDIIPAKYAEFYFCDSSNSENVQQCNADILTSLLPMSLQEHIKDANMPFVQIDNKNLNQVVIDQVIVIKYVLENGTIEDETFISDYFRTNDSMMSMKNNDHNTALVESKQDFISDTIVLNPTYPSFIVIMGSETVKSKESYVVTREYDGGAIGYKCELGMQQYID